MAHDNGIAADLRLSAGVPLARDEGRGSDCDFSVDVDPLAARRSYSGVCSHNEQGAALLLNARVVRLAIEVWAHDLREADC
jgi:hypothetical protein